MSILIEELKVYGSASMPDDDTPTGIGGAISTSKKVEFQDIGATGNIQVVSSAAGDTTQTITVTGRNASGVLISEGKQLNGTTPVAMTANTSWERLLKAIKGATTAGDVAAEAVTATRTGTCQAGSAANTIVLDSGASGADDAYLGQLVRTTGGTGPNQIRQIVKYVGATKTATVNGNWSVTPDNTTTFRVCTGFYFDKAPVEITEVRRPFYNAAAPPSGTRDYYEKIFIKNTNASLSLTSAVVIEQADPSGKVAFAVAATLDDTATNGAGNRQTHTGGLTFDSSQKSVANSGNLTNGTAQGVWLKLSLAAGDAAQKTSHTLRVQGNST